jgi:hypothetical protein
VDASDGKQSPPRITLPTQLRYADGCFIGSLWKAGQGNVVNVIGILGLLIGIGSSGFVKKATGINDAASINIPNYLSSVINPLYFLMFLWVTGILLFFFFRQSRYRY